MSDAEIKEIVIDLIFNYLNNPLKYTKNKIEENYKGAITILTKNLKEYFSTNGCIQSMQQGQRQITYKNVTLKSFLEEIKPLLPKAKPKAGVVYV